MGLMLMVFFFISVLLAWTLSNALLAAVITATNDLSSANKAVNGYMAFLLYSVAGLACELFFFFFESFWLIFFFFFWDG
jgi:hypothetical protein